MKLKHRMQGRIDHTQKKRTLRPYHSFTIIKFEGARRLSMKNAWGRERETGKTCWGAVPIEQAKLHEWVSTWSPPEIITPSGALPTSHTLCFFISIFQIFYSFLVAELASIFVQ